MPLATGEPEHVGCSRFRFAPIDARRAYDQQITFQADLHTEPIRDIAIGSRQFRLLDPTPSASFQHVDCTAAAIDTGRSDGQSISVERHLAEGISILYVTGLELCLLRPSAAVAAENVNRTCICTVPRYPHGDRIPGDRHVSAKLIPDLSVRGSKFDHFLPGRPRPLIDVRSAGVDRDLVVVLRANHCRIAVNRHMFAKPRLYGSAGIAGGQDGLLHPQIVTHVACGLIVANKDIGVASIGPVACSHDQSVSRRRHAGEVPVIRAIAGQQLLRFGERGYESRSRQAVLTTVVIAEGHVDQVVVARRCGRVVVQILMRQHERLGARGAGTDRVLFDLVRREWIAPVNVQREGIERAGVVDGDGQVRHAVFVDSIHRIQRERRRDVVHGDHRTRDIRHFHIGSERQVIVRWEPCRAVVEVSDESVATGIGTINQPHPDIAVIRLCRTQSDRELISFRYRECIFPKIHAYEITDGGDIRHRYDNSRQRRFVALGRDATDRGANVNNQVFDRTRAAEHKHVDGRQRSGGAYGKCLCVVQIINHSHADGTWKPLRVPDDIVVLIQDLGKSGRAGGVTAAIVIAEGDVDHVVIQRGPCGIVVQVRMRLLNRGCTGGIHKRFRRGSVAPIDQQLERVGRSGVAERAAERGDVVLVNRGRHRCARQGRRHVGHVDGVVHRGRATVAVVHGHGDRIRPIIWRRE